MPNDAFSCGAASDVDLSATGVLWLLSKHYGDGDAQDEPRKYTDAVAVAGVKGVTGSQRRAVVYILSTKDDASSHPPAVVRRYLQSVGVPLFVWSLTGPRPDLAEAWAVWSDIFALPQLDEGARKPAPRRRRRNAIRDRRPKFLMRRRTAMTRELPVHREEREIIARN